MTKKHDIIWLDSIDSTNDEARRHISELDNLSVLSVSDQTAGKGQRGNSWLSTAGENLTFSIVLKNSPDWKTECLKASDQYIITRVTAESVVDLLARCGIQAWIKQPNDIYVDDMKICGILIENGIRGDRLDYSIIGIGLNVNQTLFDPSLPNPISMCSITGRRYFLRDLLDEFMEIFSEKMLLSLA